MEPDGRVEGVVFFWRPGCGFCIALRRALQDAGFALHEANIWDDPRAAEAVRAIANGNETVPTVVVGPARMVNPTAREVLDAVAQHAPHLLPASR